MTNDQQQSWLVRTRQLGLAQIDASLSQVQQKLDYCQLSWFDWLFWTGRRRELRAARWLVVQILPVTVVVVPEAPPTVREPQGGSALVPQIEGVTAMSFSESSNAAIAFNNILNKIQGKINNLSGIPLEIEALQLDKKRELLFIVWQQVKQNLEKLRLLNLNEGQLSEQISLTLQEIWHCSAMDFFGKYYRQTSLASRQNLDKILAEEEDIIKEGILSKIPLVKELFSYFVFDKNLAIDNVEYRPESPEARKRADLLLQNLILQVANGVMAVILNNFSEVEEIKKILYGSPMLSAREIARFRNDLSWRYRQDKYWQEPKDIFESKYRLLTWENNSIVKTFIYSSRQQELDQLRGIPWAVTVVWEARDAIAPRLRAILRAIGNGLVYLLTQIIGRGIGLIGRGIIQGIGHTLQDVRYGKNGDQGNSLPKPK